jgi:hypothetical protein
MIAETPVSGSLPVNERIIVFPNFAYHGLLLSLYMVTNGSVGLVPNEVKCKVLNEHSCSIPVNTLPVQKKLLNILELSMMFQLLSLTTMLSTLPVPLEYCACVNRMVSVAGISLNALPESVDVSYTMKLMYPFSMIIVVHSDCKKSCVPGSVRLMPVRISIFPILGISSSNQLKSVTLSFVTEERLV